MSVTISSIVGVMCHSRCMALFGSLTSTHSLIAPGCFGLGAITKGDTHRVGPVTFSINPMRSRFSNSFSTLGWRWNGTRLCLRAVGLMDLSMCSFIFRSFRHPSPWNNSGYSSRMFAACVPHALVEQRIRVLDPQPCGILTVCLCSSV